MQGVLHHFQLLFGHVANDGKSSLLCSRHDLYGEFEGMSIFTGFPLATIHECYLGLPLILSQLS